jgi:hypothetical protein
MDIDIETCLTDQITGEQVIDADRHMTHLRLCFQEPVGQSFRMCLERQIELLRQPLEDKPETMTPEKCRDELIRIATLKAVLRIPETVNEAQHRED